MNVRDFPQPERILVVLPTWVGDNVMATPTLRALNELYPDAKVTGLVKAGVRPVLDASPHIHRWITLHSKKGKGSKEDRKRRFLTVVRRLRRKQFDLAVLLPNSLRTAILAKRAKIKRRLGYDRDGRGFLLTDRILPLKQDGAYVPVSAVQYYLGLARYLGSDNPDSTMKLHTRAKHDEQALKLLDRIGVGRKGEREQPLVILNPGAANHGDAKIWPGERYAELADALVEKHNARVMVSGAPNEKAILDKVHAGAKNELIDLPGYGIDLYLLKSIVAQCDLMVSNDTGPRHIAAALGVPVVSLFGPTDPRWAIANCPYETILRCTEGAQAHTMSGLGVDEVYEAARRQIEHVKLG